MYRITRTTFIRKDGSIEYSNDVVEVQNLEEYRTRIKGNNISVNFIFQEIDGNGENSTDSQTATAEDSSE